MFLSMSSPVLNLQSLSPVWSNGLNVILRSNPSKHKRALQKKDVQGRNETSLRKHSPCLLSYLDRMMPFTSFLSIAGDECLTVDYFFPPHDKSSFLLRFANTWQYQPIRTFKTRRPTTADGPKMKTSHAEMENEQKDDLAHAIKLLAKSSEKKEDQKLKTAWKIFQLLISGAFFVAAFSYIYRSMVKPSFGKSTDDTGITTNITFDDIRGADEVKAELADIVEFLKDPAKFTDMGAKLPKGILLVGPPGTGKTLLAKAVAGEAGVSFFYASGSEFDELLVGMGALRVRQLFDKARKRAPSIIFLDEIDACGGKRASTTVQPYARQTINQLLQEMDGFTENDTVVVLAATNDVKVLDRALIRPGRFDTQIQVLLPDIEGRKEILQLYIDKLNSVAESIDLDRLASLTMEMTGADLSNLVNQAALRSVKLNKTTVDQDDLEFALDKVRMGPELKSRIRTDKELKETAYHEAGHALVAFYTPTAMNIYKATIMQRGAALGHVSLVPSKEDETTKSKSKLLAQIDVCMGGKVAEEIAFGKENVGTGASSDIANATELAYRIVCMYGMSDKMGPMAYDMNNLSEETKRAVESEVKLILNQSYEKARKLLLEKSFEHKLLAESLLRYESLAAEEIKILLESKDVESVAIKRKKELELKMLKKLEKSANLDVGLKAPVIDYIPTRNDVDL